MNDRRTGTIPVMEAAPQSQPPPPPQTQPAVPANTTVPGTMPAPLPRTPPMRAGYPSGGHPAAYGPPSGAPVPSLPQELSAPAMPGVRPRVVQFPQVGSVMTSPRGAYIVQNVIGSGEFGAVYEAIGPFDQVYAVKMMRPANRPYVEVQADWAKEVSRLVTLRHPNIVYIHDAFEENHLFYLALERCDHPMLAMLGQPMQEGLVIELGRQILAAVQFLHDNDVVHDDLHPGNVLITHHDRPVVKISDFGISHELRGMGAVRPNVVHHAIMAPELLVTGYTSRQSDLYQVGLLFYWMLTGQSAIPKDAAYQELVQMVGDGMPRARAESIGTPLGALVAKMLRRRETYRYTSAREVWAELRELPAWKTRALFPPK